MFEDQPHEIGPSIPVREQTSPSQAIERLKLCKLKTLSQGREGKKHFASRTPILGALVDMRQYPQENDHLRTKNQQSVGQARRLRLRRPGDALKKPWLVVDEE